MPAGRPENITPAALAAILRERAAGRSYREVARRLLAAGHVPPGGGVKWWPSVVREASLRH